jgi:hypothetical protein
MGTIHRYIKCAVEIAMILFASVLLHILALFPKLRQQIFDHVAQKSGTLELQSKMKDWVTSAGGWQFVKTLVSRSIRGASHEEPEVNQPLIDVKLVHLDGTTECSLQGFMRPNRPLIVNFGSSS